MVLCCSYECAKWQDNERKVNTTNGYHLRVEREEWKDHNGTEMARVNVFREGFFCSKGDWLKNRRRLYWQAAVATALDFYFISFFASALLCVCWGKRQLVSQLSCPHALGYGLAINNERFILVAFHPHKCIHVIFSFSYSNEETNQKKSKMCV